MTKGQPTNRQHGQAAVGIGMKVQNMVVRRFFHVLPVRWI
jgi:hypothetical protein